MLVGQTPTTHGNTISAGATNQAHQPTPSFPAMTTCTLLTLELWPSSSHYQGHTCQASHVIINHSHVTYMPLPSALLQDSGLILNGL